MNARESVQRTSRRVEKKKKNPNPNANDEARIRTRALNPFGTLAERLALIDDTVRYCHAAAATAGGDAILLSTWPDRGRIVLSQARLRPLPAFL